MNTTTALSLLALSLAGLALALLADAAAAAHLVAAFAATFVTLIAFLDYARPAHRRRYLASLAAATPRHPHPYAA